MTELTFNIADYRPLFRVRTHVSDQTMHGRSGFVVLNSNSDRRKHEQGWADPCPAVVEIRSVREAHWILPRRAKILRFSNPASHRLYTMPAPEPRSLDDDDPDPLVA